jgi:hypothetical protein
MISDFFIARPVLPMLAILMWWSAALPCSLPVAQYPDVVPIGRSVYPLPRRECPPVIGAVPTTIEQQSTASRHDLHAVL